MKNSIEIEIPDTPENRKAWEQLRKETLEGELVMYGKVGDNYIPIANFSRHPQCPKELFDRFINKIVQCEL